MNDLLKRQGKLNTEIKSQNLFKKKLMSEIVAIMELTHLLDGDYDNYHFEEDVKDHDVLFSYHLMSGRAQSRNAIKLLEVIGFTQDITQKSQEMAECFIKTGKWEDSYVR